MVSYLSAILVDGFSESYSAATCQGANHVMSAGVSHAAKGVIFSKISDHRTRLAALVACDERCRHAADAGLDPENRYLKYEAHSTNHVFEANIGYDFGFASLQWYTNFAGNDGINKDGKRAYSSYFEAIVPFKLATVDWTATAGVVPYATDFYNEWTSGFSVTNLALKASKDIKITDTFSVPVFAELSANPCTQNAYLVLGLTLHP